MKISSNLPYQYNQNQRNINQAKKIATEFGHEHSSQAKEFFPNNEIKGSQILEKNKNSRVSEVGKSSNSSKLK